MIRTNYPLPNRVIERAAARVENAGGCSISTYSTGSHGYAQIGWTNDGKNYVTLVHIVLWRSVHGDIPEGYTVDHTCKNKRCANIAHLRLLLNFENARRTSGRDWELGECANGHSNKHLRLYSAGQGKTRLRCSICHREQQSRYRRKKKALN